MLTYPQNLRNKHRKNVVRLSAPRASRKQTLYVAVCIVKMSTSSFAQIETLHGDNYDTWKFQMKAVLIKSHAWEYVSGECVKPMLEVGKGL